MSNSLHFAPSDDLNEASDRFGYHVRETEDSFRSSNHPRQHIEGFRRKKKKKKTYDEGHLIGQDKAQAEKFWNRITGAKTTHGITGVTMPMTGGTRMLRARRKDCNLKPNRRLDRKSSRGMLFENEELRMRTITINAEVEQGQHALKKLRRENEQLRREMWSLRDEYDKMEKLLRKKETDEDSNQENSDSEGSPSDDSVDEKLAIKEAASQQEEAADSESNESLLKTQNFGNEANVRTFDGLSVIDEQTEETQTTESPLGCGTLSRGNSANRAMSPPGPLFDEACGISDFPQFGFGPTAKPLLKKKATSPSYESGIFPSTWTADTYETRPASPYPCNGSHHQDSYQKRFQVLQNLSTIPPAPEPAQMSDGRWICPDPSKLPELPEYDIYVNQPYQNAYLPQKPVELTACTPTFPPPTFPYNLIQDRTGPDVFVADGFPSNGRPPITGITTIKEADEASNLEAKLKSRKRKVLGHLAEAKKRQSTREKDGKEATRTKDASFNFPSGEALNGRSEIRP
ncbi:hypothetical protein RUM44_001985 [Polyplax serrata]|uniref:Uncharacterized protein n=1 Tax=Polyplax serrata TaxID=468196 RepID=A0ABR1ALL9_POLSC